MHQIQYAPRPDSDMQEWFRAKVGKNMSISICTQGGADIGAHEIEKLLRLLEAMKFAVAAEPAEKPSGEA